MFDLLCFLSMTKCPSTCWFLRNRAEPLKKTSRSFTVLVFLRLFLYCFQPRVWDQFESLKSAAWRASIHRSTIWNLSNLFQTCFRPSVGGRQSWKRKLKGKNKRTPIPIKVRTFQLMEKSGTSSPGKKFPFLKKYRFTVIYINSASNYI